MTGSGHTRRRFLTTLAAAVGGSAAIVRPRAAARPNILFALADDWSWTGATTRDDLALSVPTFRRLCAEGVQFANAFVAAPSCSASRAAMLTGQWIWRLEDGANLAGTLDRRFPVYPDLLQQSGYHVGFTRKGWAPGQIAPGHRPRNPAGDAFQDFDAFLQARPSGAPFCFWFGSNDPHRIYDVGRGVRGGLTESGLRVPGYLPDVPEVRGDMLDYRFGVERFDREVGALLKTLEQRGEIDNTIIVMTGDNGWPFPRGKATLYDSGTHVPLAIRWSGVRNPGRATDAIVSLSDLAPTLLEAAGVKRPGTMTGQSLLPILQDVPGAAARRDHTLTAMERHMDCRTIAGQGFPMRAIRTHDFLYIRNFAPGRAPAGDASVKPWTAADIATGYFAGFGDIDPGPSKAFLITHRDEPAVRPFFQRAAGSRPARELYAVATDPEQLQNIAERPAMAATVAELDRQLMEALKQTKDPRAAGKGDVFDRYPAYNDPGFERPPVI